MSYIYLASPYAHENESVREKRFYEVCRCAAYYMKQRQTIFSPIAHSHPIAKFSKLPKGFTFWKKFDLDMLRLASSFWILCLADWRKSEGINAELAFAKLLELPVYQIIPDYAKETYMQERVKYYSETANAYI